MGCGGGGAAVLVLLAVAAVEAEAYRKSVCVLGTRVGALNDARGAAFI